MPPSLHYTEEARTGIRDAAQWIRQYDRKAAATWTEGLIRQCQLLSRHPNLGRVRPELSVDTHVFPYRNHLIFYDITARGILILYVIDARQDIPNLPL